MKSISIIPKDEAHWLELRKQDLTSTEISALFGISPYSTEFEVWHRHKDGLSVGFEANERSTWGLRLQDSIAKGIAEDEKWKVRRMPEYMRDEKLRVGSSFDFAIEEKGLLEIKNVDALVFKDGWLVEDGELEAPPHIEMQLQHQLMVSDRSFAYIGALIGGNTIKLLKREPDDKVFKAIQKKAEQFWNTIADGKAPDPDFSRDIDTIKALYSQAKEGTVLDVRNDREITSLMHEYQALNANKKVIETSLEEIKGQLILKAGDAEKLIGENFSISMGVVKGGHVEYDRKDYRAFKPFFKKVK